MSANFLIWNTRGIVNARTQGTLNHLIKTHKICFAAIIEPLVVPRQEVCRKLNLEFKAANINNQIWILAEQSWKVEVRKDVEQMLHIKISIGSIKTSTCQSFMENALGLVGVHYGQL